MDVNTDHGYCRIRNHDMALGSSPACIWPQMASRPAPESTPHHCHCGSRWQASLQCLPTPRHVQFFLSTRTILFLYYFQFSTTYFHDVIKSSIPQGARWAPGCLPASWDLGRPGQLSLIWAVECQMGVSVFSPAGAWRTPDVYHPISWGHGAPRQPQC